MSIYVTNGASSQCGIYLAGSNGSVSKAAYAHRVAGRLECKTGSPEEIKKLFTTDRLEGCQDEDEGLGKVALMFWHP